MTIYIDSNNRCHTKPEACLRAGFREVETSFFDGKCEEFIEGFAYSETESGFTIYPIESYEGLSKTQAAVDKTLEAVAEFMGVRGRWNGSVFEIVKGEVETGDFTNPIRIPPNGITTETGKWYYVDDKELPHEAITDAFVIAEDFYDRRWFDYVE